jgi:hypothetical protein
MAKQATAKEFILPLEIKVNEQTHKLLAEAVGGDEIGQPVKGLLEDFLIHFSQGGFVVTANDIDRMSQAVGEKVSTSKKVVEVVDRVAGKRQGAYEFTVTVDPNMIDAFNDIAASRSMTLQDVVSDAWNTCTALGWLYAVPTPCQQFMINEAQHKAIEKIIGKGSFNGTDIVNALVKASKKGE